MKVNWFLRNTGSTVKKAFSDCECTLHGRPYCYGCVVENDYTEQPIRFSNTTTKPNWLIKRQKTHLTPTDIRFLAGLPEVKPFYQKRRRQPWKQTW